MLIASKPSHPFVIGPTQRYNDRYMQPHPAFDVDTRIWRQGLTLIHCIAFPGPWVAFYKEGLWFLDFQHLGYWGRRTAGIQLLSAQGCRADPDAGWPEQVVRFLRTQCSHLQVTIRKVRWCFSEHPRNIPSSGKHKARTNGAGLGGK